MFFKRRKDNEQKKNDFQFPTTEGMDEYLWKAAEILIDNKHGSVSILQLKLKISFNRALDIMEQLCQIGVVSERKGDTLSRDVLVNKNELKEIANNIKGKKSIPLKCENTEIEQESATGYKEKNTCTLKDIETILRFSFGIDADYSNDGENLENIKNIIIPSSSNEIQTEVINTLLSRNSPLTMKMILIDDSAINYISYNPIPHMLIPVVTNEDKIRRVIEWCFTEMQSRINKFVQYGAKNIDSFNQKMIDTGGKTHQKIVCVVNEISVFLKYVKIPLESMFLNCNMTGIYFIMFSRFSLKSLSLGRLSELFEVYSSDKLKLLLSQERKAENKQRMETNYDDMEGHQFEYFCADVLRKNGFKNVDVTQGSGDHGIDILAEKDDITYAIQCKCYSSNIGNVAVQQAHTGKSLYHKDIAVVMTNRYFTPQAIQEAEELGVKLWDRDFLNKHIEENECIYENNHRENSPRILDTEERIVAIEDEEISKYLYQYIEAASRIAIDLFLRDGDGNSYTEDMIRNTELPIRLYNVKFTKLTKCVLHFVYYCGMNLNFKNTNAYNKLVELSIKNNKKYDNNLFKIDVFYNVCDIVLEDKKIKIEQIPEVDISTDNLNGIQLLEDIDEYDLQTGYKYLVTENFFPMKIDNIIIKDTK
ncbi:MAG: restriction endonuclease [Lachnospiraceae bacterium]|nr:restriction endonuclease [Lachnospiraceae bacterium]